MMEFFYDQAFDVVGDVGIGVVFWLLAFALPFRALSGRAEVGWDVLGYFGSFAAGIAVVYLLEDPLLGRTEPAFATWYAAYGQLPWAGTLLFYIAISDLGAYWAHRVLHTQLFWDAHAWHHSPKYMYFLSGTRAAPLHVLILTAPYTAAYILFPSPEAPMIALAHMAFQTANQHYIHSNLWFPFARHLEYVLVTPRMHFVHHSATRSRCDSNYGFIFSIWDRLFGTYTDPETVPADDTLGLNYEVSNWRGFLGLPPQRL